MPRTTTATTAALLALLTGCANEPETPALPETVDIHITLATTSHNIGQAPDGDTEQCVWRDPTYTIRDGADEIIATGEATSTLPGTASAADHRAELGSQRASDPYECVLPVLIEDVPAADFYTIEVTTVELDITAIFQGDTSGKEVTAEVTVDRAEAESETPVEIEL
ncbi:hypothetical protein [Nocardiopsis changdeensis]|uniref:hypothetical protein n=1 Tax=Nocardiopsis changdeensis TaxID=2831969 RepID=UPI003F45E0A7